MIKKTNKELKVKKSIISAINDLKNSDLSDINFDDSIEKFEIFEDSLSTVIFFTALETRLTENFNFEVQLDIEKLGSDDIKNITKINDLVVFISNSVSI